MYRKLDDNGLLVRIESENKTLAGVLGERDSELAALKAELDGLKAEEDQLGDEMAAVQTNIEATDKLNKDLRDQIIELESQLRDETSLGRKVRLDLREYSVNKNSRENELASLNSHIGILEDELARNVKVKLF